jgi:hypothetical protein
MTGKPQPETAASETPSVADSVEKPAPAHNRAARDRIQFPNRKNRLGCDIRHLAAAAWRHQEQALFRTIVAVVRARPGDMAAASLGADRG